MQWRAEALEGASSSPSALLPFSWSAACWPAPVGPFPTSLWVPSPAVSLEGETSGAGCPMLGALPSSLFRILLNFALMLGRSVEGLLGPRSIWSSGAGASWRFGASSSLLAPASVHASSRGRLGTLWCFFFALPSWSCLILCGSCLCVWHRCHGIWHWHVQSWTQ